MKWRYLPALAFSFLVVPSIATAQPDKVPNEKRRPVEVPKELSKGADETFASGKIYFI